MLHRKELIKLSYPGAEISVNHLYGRRKTGGYYIKPEAKAWAEELGWLLKHCHLENWKLPITVVCSGTFKNERAAPDLSNLSKLTLDTIEEITGVNDSNMRWKDGDRNIDPKVIPFILLTLIEGENEKNANPQKTQKASHAPGSLSGGLSEKRGRMGRRNLHRRPL